MIRAYPQLYRAAEQFGFHRACFELGIVVGYVMFSQTRAVLATFLATGSLMLLVNYFLRKDPQYFRILPRAKRVPQTGSGHLKGGGSRRVVLYAPR